MFANRKTKRVNHYANIVTKVIFVQKKILDNVFQNYYHDFEKLSQENI